MSLSFMTPLIFSVLNFLVCVFYPAIDTFSYLYKDEIKNMGDKYANTSIVSQPSHSSLYAHFIVYWIIYFSTQFIEYLFFTTILVFIPLYYEIKLLTFFWLGSSHFKGAGYLYLTYLKTLIKDLLRIGENKLEEMVGPQSYSQIKDSLISISLQNNSPPISSSKNGNSRGRPSNK
ncbi:hypothetical protein BMR1_02g01100 [Babesia microti strain RI]|uniref:Uncharacterized protein n=1 Tax=Babesia microti (strain RI) TaxID=1133968 RepID=I7J9M3_BABMR|nr:hypothetical protein BMR1_02g01100 [Babesia microti strain RI]CCF73384.1 hypothetical protein BMR1_02g01100 [Babesia microti strain RI]|eukprot:XP_012647993.1 hypothetical protein BMR1_02g01100 [Babesia microti strain RI]